MKKYKHPNKIKLLQKSYVLIALLCVVVLILGIGYAQIASITLDVSGVATATPPRELFITDITYLSNNNSNPSLCNINDPTQTIMSSSIVLGNTLSSTITYKVKIRNNTNQPAQYDDAIYQVGVGYDNTDIEFQISGLTQGYTLYPNQEVEFNITFKYIDSLSNITNNTLNSAINFKFNEISKVARIGNTYYDTLQQAITAAPNNTATTVELLKDTSEAVGIANTKNIVLDLGNYTISNNGNNNVIENNGTLTIANGTITSDSTQKSTVQNTSQGTLTITGGTITSGGNDALENAGTLTIGTQDNNIDITSPVIRGDNYGINSSVNYSFYNGVAKGKTAGINDTTKVTSTETGYEIVTVTEQIGGDTYSIAHLGINALVTFDPNNGQISEPTRNVAQGYAVGPLPVPTRTDYTFGGWYTGQNSGTEVTEDTIINGPITYYAFWIPNTAAARIGFNTYNTVQLAINAVPTDDTPTTIEVLKDISERLTIRGAKNIIFELEGRTLTNKGNSPIIESDGTVTISNGTFNSTANQAILNNEGGTMYITGGNFSATARQVLYVTADGTVTISGNPFMTSNTSGKPSNSNMERATIQVIAGSVTITGGTIIGTVQQAISNEGTVTIGNKDGNISTTDPVIRGEKDAIKSTGTLNYYDGIIKGKTNLINGTTSDLETGTSIVTGSEVIDNKTYITGHLEPTP